MTSLRFLGRGDTLKALERFSKRGGEKGVIPSEARWPSRGIHGVGERADRNPKFEIPGVGGWEFRIPNSEFRILLDSVLEKHLAQRQEELRELRDLEMGLDGFETTPGTTGLPN